MNIEVRGVNFKNKGAQLMLETVRQKLLIKYGSKTNLCVQLGVANKSRILENRLKYVFRYDINKKYYNSLNPLVIPTSGMIGDLANRFNLLENVYINDSDIDCILDISGFAYGDQLGSKSSRLLAELSVKWAKQDKKLILLPQAYGPFENREIVNSFNQVIDNASLVFVRDGTSFSYLNSTYGHSKKFIKCPDITIGLEINRTEYQTGNNPFKNRLVFIASERMLDKTSVTESNKYINKSAKLIDNLLANGHDVILAVHENDDREISKKINNQVKNHDLSIIIESDPIKLKYMLGEARFIISSRYHGLVNALSQNVPVLATGWSHKYQELLNDYNYPVEVINIGKEEVTTTVQKVEDIMKNEQEIIEALKDINNDFQKIISQSWNMIFNQLELK